MIKYVHRVPGKSLFLLKPQMKSCLPVVILLLLSDIACGQELNHVYKSGENGYLCFRIPAIVTTNKGTLLAFAEARRNGCGDAGDIDLVVKRSANGGKTWTAMEIVWNDGENTCGNPAPVVDKETGRVLLLSTWNLGSDHEKDIIAGTSKDTRRIFVLSSTDDGNSWSVPREITRDVKKEGWTWYATGPVNGIQLRKGKHEGRLVIPCDHIEAASKKYFSHSIYSDDGGTRWTLGGTTPQDLVNECTVAELPNGTLMLNMRNYGPTKQRKISISKDGGESWSDLKTDAALVEPVCQGSLLWYNHPGKKQFLAFSNPESTTSRVAMTVKISYNKGKTWPLKNLLHAGPSAYSNLVQLPDGNLGCLYEAGIQTPYEGIVFEEIDLHGFGKN
ncbi:MAG TPA: sialidase family protein [Agriterribacter sp.]|nr:sialidase family protein [Agriterribacter sp.]